MYTNSNKCFSSFQISPTRFLFCYITPKSTNGGAFNNPNLSTHNINTNKLNITISLTSSRQKKRRRNKLYIKRKQGS